MQNLKIAYILEKFPSPTEYFILNEILYLEKNNFEIYLLVLRKQKQYKDLPELKNLKSAILYLPKIYFFFPLLLFFHSPLSLFHFIPSSSYHGLTSFSQSRSFNFCLPSSVSGLLKSFRNFSISVFFKQKLRNTQINHIHAHFAFIATDIAQILSELMHVKYSFTAHAQDIYLNLDGLPEKIRKASFAITCTKYNKDYLNGITNHHFKEKIFHVYHGTDIKKWETVKRIEKGDDGHIHILSVARLVEKKGLICLLKAVNLLNDRNKKVNCLIIGEGPLKNNLKRFIQDNKLQGQVRIEPFVSQADLKQHYCNADMFVLPCRIAENGDRDGLPNVILEAMASGTPVIATHTAAMGELIRDKENGILVPEKDENALADAIMRLQSDPGLYNTIAKKGINTVYEYFPIEKCCSELSRIFELHIK